VYQDWNSSAVQKLSKEENLANSKDSICYIY